MDISNNTKKMFNVLVVTGALLGTTQALAQGEDSEIKCKLEITKTAKLPIINKVKSKTICLDDEDVELTISEIDNMIKIEADENDCASPFCGCWLG